MRILVLGDSYCPQISLRAALQDLPGHERHVRARDHRHEHRSDQEREQQVEVQGHWPSTGLSKPSAVASIRTESQRWPSARTESRRVPMTWKPARSYARMACSLKV